MNQRTALFALFIIVVLAVGFGLYRSQRAVAQQPIMASYACNGGKAIIAAYYAGSSTPATSADQPPVPGGRVVVSLSDGRTLELPQTISADGTRYANADESFVFWGKGNGALVLENNQEKSFIGCVTIATDPGALPRVYQSSEGFSIRYPEGFTVDESYQYQALGPGKDIAGIKFTIPLASVAGTNLSSDSALSVETLPRVETCDASLFLGQGVKSREVDDVGVTYSVASSTDAAAGNRYEETVYALPGTNPCIAVRYFIHYGAIENYPPEAAHAFDKAALLTQLDSIRRTLTVVR